MDDKEQMARTLLPITPPEGAEFDILRAIHYKQKLPSRYTTLYRFATSNLTSQLLKFGLIERWEGELRLTGDGRHRLKRLNGGTMPQMIDLETDYIVDAARVRRNLRREGRT